MISLNQRDINYAATICRIERIEKHPNADKLFLVELDGDICIVDSSYKVGDLVVKFPLECTINKDFLADQNAFRDKTLNKDSNETGYFEHHGRVRALKLRGILCGCYAHRLELFNEYFSTEFDGGDIGKKFTDIDNVNVCKKYIPANFTSVSTGNKVTKKIKNKDLIEPAQFRFHWDTEHMTRNIHKLSPGDLISVTYKLHGTSGITANVLVKDTSLKAKILRLFGIHKTKYAIVSASRKVIKSVGFKSDQKHGHYYKVDLWSEVSRLLTYKVSNGITLYYEIVGYTPDGAYIQKGYDYGYSKPEESWEMGVNFGVYVYRITYTTPEGKVIEFGWPQIKEYCQSKGLNHVPEVSFTLVSDPHTHVMEFKADIERDCTMCVNKVPMEGVVIRRETNGIEAFKLKSDVFKLYESAQLDLGEADIESIQ